MMMCLGQFGFDLTTIAHQQLQRQMAWRHASNNRVGAPSAMQYLGIGDETMTLPGVILPQFGNADHLFELRRMAKTGAAFVLVDGNGRLYGKFAITELSETGTLLNEYGEPQRIEFSLSLKRVIDITELI